MIKAGRSQTTSPKTTAEIAKIWTIQDKGSESIQVRYKIRTLVLGAQLEAIRGQKGKHKSFLTYNSKIVTTRMLIYPPLCDIGLLAHASLHYSALLAKIDSSFLYLEEYCLISCKIFSNIF